MLYMPWSLYVHPDASFKSPTCRCFQRFTTEGEDYPAASQSGKYGLLDTLGGRSKKAVNPAKLSVSTLCFHTFKLSCYLCSRIASSARSPYIPHVLGR